MNSVVFVGEHSKTFDVRWHSHETWELVYCTSGQGVFRFRDGRTIPYHAGEVVGIPPQEVHSNTSEEGFTNIRVNLSEFTSSNHVAFKIQDENSSLLKAFMEAKIYFNSDYSKKELILAALGELIASYVNAFRNNVEFTEMVDKIRSTILHSYTDPEFELDEYIRSLPFHYDYLRKLFKKELGMSPLEYLTTQRMKNAERLLSTVWTSGYSVAEIARMCGFDNALYFSRVFRKSFGCSPTQFLKKQRDAQMSAPDILEQIMEE
jgi:AraC-like DNA-binding protein